MLFITRTKSCENNHFSSNRFAGMEDNEKRGLSQRYILWRRVFAASLLLMQSHALPRSLAPNYSSIVHPHIHKSRAMSLALWRIFLDGRSSTLLFNRSVKHLLHTDFNNIICPIQQIGRASLPEQYEKQHCIFSPNWCPNELIEAGVLCTLEERSIWWGKLVSRNFDCITNIIQWIQSQY